MSVRRLEVLLHGRVIGRLEQQETARDPSFTYDDRYAADGSVALSARLPIQRASFPPARVAPYLHGLLPESLDARTRWADRLGTDPDDTVGMLAQMGWDCPGAVQFCRSQDLSELAGRGGELVPVDEAQIAERLRRLVVEPASWTMEGEHWSLGGQQEKFALAQVGGRWFQAQGSAATTHIVKPGIRRLHGQALVEHLTMRAAAVLGVDITRTQYLRFEDQWAIVATRFDRVVADDGHISRLHQEDLCQAVGRMPARKYESRGGPTLADMTALAKRESSDLAADRLALADFLIVNAVGGAPDGHAKNISVLRLPGRTWIAPLYDLATSLTYDSAQVDRTVAVSVGGERQVSRIRRRQWEKAAQVLGVDAPLMLRRVQQLAQGFPTAFAAALQEVGAVPSAEEIERRALPALAAHCARVVDQLT